MDNRRLVLRIADNRPNVDNRRRIFSLQNGHPGFSFVLLLQTNRSSRSEGVRGQVRVQNSLEMLYKQLSNSLGSIRKRLVRIYSVYIRRTCFSIATRRFKTILFIWRHIWTDEVHFFSKSVISSYMNGHALLNIFSLEITFLESLWWYFSFCLARSAKILIF